MLLALYPEEQRKLREESLKVWPTEDDIKLSMYRRDFDKFVNVCVLFFLSSTDTCYLGVHACILSRESTLRACGPETS